MSQVTVLSTGHINGADVITVQLIRPDHNPAIIRILWPPQPTVTDPQRFPEMAAAIATMFAAASTELSRIKARKR